MDIRTVSGSTLLRQKGLKSYAENREINLWLANYSCDDVEILAKPEKESCALATVLSACMRFIFPLQVNPVFLPENLSKVNLYLELRIEIS